MMFVRLALLDMRPWHNAMNSRAASGRLFARQQNDAQREGCRDRRAFPARAAASDETPYHSIALASPDVS